jgi:hypothetical protein
VKRKMLFSFQQKGPIMCKIENRVIQAVVLATGLFSSSYAMAAESTGRIAVYHVNINSSQRGACIQMIPALSTTWACLPSRANSTPVYDQIHDLLLIAWIHSKTCTITWNRLDAGGAQQIITAECR